MIGGKVVDSSALAAYVRGSVAMDSWLAVAKELGIVLYVPALAVIEFARYVRCTPTPRRCWRGYLITPR